MILQYRSIMNADRVNNENAISIVTKLTITTTAVTTYYLVQDAHIHFPVRLLLLHITAALVILIGRQLHKHGWTWFADYATYIHNRSRPSPRPLICRAFAMVFLYCIYQSLFHLPSPICLALVLSLAPVLATAISRFNHSHRVLDVYRTLLVAACISTIYLNDYRLTPDGISISLTALGCYVATHLCHASNSTIDEAPEEDAGNRLLSILLAAWFIIAASILVLENHSDQDFYFSDAPFLICFSIVSGGVAILSSHKLFARSSGAAAPAPLVIDIVSIPGLVFLGFIVAQHWPVVSIWQLAAFLFAAFDVSASSFFARFLHSSSVLDDEPVQTLPDESYDNISVLEKKDDLSKSKKIICIRETVGTLLELIVISCVITSWTLMLLRAFRRPYNLANGAPANVPDVRDNTLDIVVAYHHESMIELLENLNALLALPNLATLQRKVYLYSKSTTIPINTIAAALDIGLIGANFTVLPLRNIGLEGDTFLHHMSEHWDDLADHTIFMQAGVHNPWYAWKRVEDYFHPLTGFLSLWHSNIVCHDCGSCRDHSRWRENPDVIREFFASANGEAECRDIMLTYRGQFVASRARIQGNSKAMYRDLRARLDDKVDEYEDIPGVGFGYTLERMWGTILRCPGTKDIMDRCPSMASGLIGNVGALGDCQCLDSE